jgi:G3E family GTPase
MTRLILIGGFLGAGKTTLLLAAARKLRERGLRVGIVTNDQGSGLVDTALAARARLPVVEVAGGCFCCRLPDLLSSLDTLQRTVAPDVILAEPVGSCTDIMATVMRPLAARAEATLAAMSAAAPTYTLAPFTVLVDPRQLARPDQGAAEYVYRKQLEEAELIGVTKLDTVDPPLGAATLHRLQQRYGPDYVLPLAAPAGAGVDAWLDVVLARRSELATRLDIDYATYAAAEAALGWLNATGVVEADVPFSAQNWLAYLLRMLDAALGAARGRIAHVKAQVHAGAAVYKASITENSGPITWDVQEGNGAAGAVGRLEFVLNARVEIAPQVLEGVVRAVLAELAPEPALRYTFTELACFSPAPPQPVERIVAL